MINLTFTHRPDLNNLSDVAQPMEESAALFIVARTYDTEVDELHTFLCDDGTTLVFLSEEDMNNGDDSDAVASMVDAD